MNIPATNEELRALALQASLDLNRKASVYRVLTDAEKTYLWLKAGTLPEQT